MGAIPPVIPTLDLASNRIATCPVKDFTFDPVPVNQTFEPTTETIIKMDDPKIRYIGRFDQTNAQTAVRWSWPASYFRVRIEGRSFKLTLADPDNHTLVWIDNNRCIDIPPSERPQKIIVATDLDPSFSHDVVVFKRSEYAPDPGQIFNLFLDGGATLLDAPEQERKIVFVGDSFTSGYGNIATTPTSFPANITTDEDASQTYAAFTAENLQADYQMLAISGIGIFRNRTDSNEESPDSMENRYTRTLFTEEGDYDFSQFDADLVHIFIGLNDFAQGEPPPNAYINNYLSLINGFRSRNPGVKFLCVGYTPEMKRDVQAMVQAEQAAGRQDIGYYELPHMELSVLAGYHPSIAGFQEGAKHVTAAIQDFMGW
jgi:lysophospholipase L1-like esterase